MAMAKIMVCCAIAMSLLVVAPSEAWSVPKQTKDSAPTAQVILHGDNAQYLLRFSGPVDHRGSRLEVMQGDRIVSSLRPLLDSEPEVLAASGPRPPAGDYQLHWAVKSTPESNIKDGFARFSVGR
jgi:hypothetical protein